MLIVLTGGAGFIGANLTRFLLQDDRMRIRVVDDFSTGRRSNLPLSERLEVIEGSVLDRHLIEESLLGASSVVHLAARPSVQRSIEDPRTTHEINATGTLNVLEAARSNGLVHTVIASSSSVYGSSEVLPKVETLVPAPMSPYAATKLAAESYALAWAQSFGLPVLVLRFFNVFGPLQTADHSYAAAIPRFIRAVLTDESIEVFGSGRQTRDFTFVDSLSRVIGEAVSNKITHHRPVNAAFGSRTSLLEIVDLVGKLACKTPSVVFRDARIGDVLHSQADATLLHQLFPNCSPTDLGESLRTTFSWYSEILGRTTTI